jgi:hypothetical protein
LAARSSAILFIICLAIVLTPILAIEYPPLADYPNHLARLFILTHPDDPELAEYYRINWSLLPNLGFDLIGYALVQIMPVELAGRVFLGIVFATALSAPMALHRALYGRLSPLPLVAGALLFNMAVQMGFLSFFLGVGLAIWAFAIWLMCRRASAVAQFAVLQLAALIIFLCHLYAMGILAILVVMSAASDGWRAAPDGFPARLNGGVKGAAPRALAFVLPLLLLLASKTGSAGEGLEYNDLDAKLAMIPISLMLDLSVFGIALVGVALIPALIAWRGGAIMLHPAVVWPVVTLLLIYLPMPDMLMSSQNADWRLIIPMAFVVVGAAQDPFRGARGRIAVGLLAICVNFGAAYNAWTLWRGGDQIVNELHATLKHLPRGAILIPYQPILNFRTAFSPPSLLHVATYAVIERAAMVPTIFAVAGQQPIEIREPYAVVRDWHVWLRFGGASPPEPARLTDPANYVLEIRTDVDATGPVPPLRLPADEVLRVGHFTLYRLRAGTAERID